MIKKFVVAAGIAVAATAAVAQSAPKVDPNATVTLTYAELSAVIQVELARANAQRAMQDAELVNKKLQEAFAPKAAPKKVGEPEAAPAK